MANPWFSEAIEQAPDIVSGARITQLTSSAVISNNIYCEQPYTSADGKHVAIVRIGDFTFGETCTLLVCDLDTSKLALIERAIPRTVGSSGASWTLGNAAWSGLLHYWTADAKLTRVSLTTLLKEVVYSNDGLNAELPPPQRGVYSVSPDQRYVIYKAVTFDGPGRKPTNSIVRIDLKNRSWKIIYKHAEICNPHLQFNPVRGHEILVQHNRGSQMDDAGNMKRATGSEGTTLFVIDVDGGHIRPLPAGEPVTTGTTGHECFIADTGRIAYTINWDCTTNQLDRRWPSGNLLHAAPGDKKPEAVPTPNHRFNHLCVSRCGNYWVCDSYPAGIPGPVPLVVGDFKTNRYATLVQDCKAPCGGGQFNHAHAYFTADNKSVIYNAAPGGVGVPQVYRAQIPAGFLESLS